ncbi:MAG: RcnB family protein [Rhodocyclales bacterium]|nr:RcnB family protein [Rhodocyclales bacterium]
MKLPALKTRCATVLLIAGIFAAGPALADKPAWAGNDKGGKSDRGDQRDERKGERKDDRKDDDRNSRQDNDRHSDGDRRHFQPQQHVLVRDYYAEHYRGRGCPPGLAKKNNGCMPPGQAKKWRVGYQLPRDVIYYSVPAPLVVQIGPPPSGHRYVRVAGDILMIAIGTGMVVDAIADLGAM